MVVLDPQLRYWTYCCGWFVSGGSAAKPTFELSYNIIVWVDRLYYELLIIVLNENVAIGIQVISQLLHKSILLKLRIFIDRFMASKGFISNQVFVVLLVVSL